MTEQLSDNSDDWPINPFDLLGVDSGAERAEVRRAYSGLIRRFRPETHPRQFQRVREAFEKVMAAIESRGLNANDVRKDLKDSVGGHEVNVSGSRPTTVAKATSHQNDLAEGIWNQFSLQPDVEQYQQIHRLADTDESTVDTYLMAYWMLRLRPDFAPSEHPVVWLTQAFRCDGADPRLVDLLLDEFRRDPSLVSQEISGGTARRIVSSELLCIYLLGRWNVLGELRYWEQLADEVDEARERLALDHPVAWFRLLSRVYEMTAFTSNNAGRSLFACMQQEITEVDSRHPGRHYSLDVLDILPAIQEQQSHGASLSGSPKLDRLLLDCTMLSCESFRRQLFELIAESLDSPAATLDSVTRLAILLPEGFWLLLREADGAGIFEELSESCESETLEALALMINVYRGQGYDQVRGAIADFSRDECLSATTILDALLSLGESVPQAYDFAEAMRQDTPLMLTCQMVYCFLEASAPPATLKSPSS